MCSWGYWFVWEVVVLWPSYAKERLEMPCLPFSLGLTWLLYKTISYTYYHKLKFLVCFPKADNLFKIIALQFWFVSSYKNVTKLKSESKCDN
jgi:hypothetical protein